MLREVAGVEISSIAHISALEEGLGNQYSNVTSEFAAMKEEVLLSSEWVTNIQKEVAQDSRNASVEVSNVRTQLAAMAERVRGVERASTRQGASAAAQVSRLEAGVAAQQRAAEAAVSAQLQRQRSTEEKSAANARWLAKQHQGVLAVEQALAKQLDHQRSTAETSAAAAEGKISYLEGKVANQAKSVERLEAVGAEMASTLRHQDEAIVGLQEGLRHQKTVSSTLEADLDREERLYLDLVAQAAKHNQTSEGQAERVRHRNLLVLGREFANRGEPATSIEDELAHARGLPEGLEEASPLWASPAEAKAAEVTAAGPLALGGPQSTPAGVERWR